MSWQKRWEIETSCADQYEQMIVTREQCKQSLRVCRKVFAQVSNFSLANLLLRISQCHVDILQLLEDAELQNGRVKSVSHESEVGPEAGYMNDAIQQPVTRLLSFQQTLLQQLRKTIRFQGDSELAYQLSASVASFQMLHDHLVQLNSQLDCSVF